MSPPPSFALSSERPSVAPGRAPSAGARRPGPSAGRPRASGVDGAPPAGTGLALAPGMKKPWKKGWRFRINMTYWEKKVPNHQSKYDIMGYRDISIFGSGYWRQCGHWAVKSTKSIQRQTVSLASVENDLSKKIALLLRMRNYPSPFRSCFNQPTHSLNHVTAQGHHSV